MGQLETIQPLTLAPCEERIKAIADGAAKRGAYAGWAIYIAVSSSARNDAGGVGGVIQISGLGFGHILEIGGTASVAQLLKGIKLGGVITIVLFLTSSDKQPALMEALNHLRIVHGIFVGSKVQFKDMNRAIDSFMMKPVVERKTFSFEDVKEVHQYHWDRKNLGKFVIQIGN